ncbi:4'-phosphopantetheinyl transferase superfamily protein [Myceligenerans cantabricum]
MRHEPSEDPGLPTIGGREVQVWWSTPSRVNWRLTDVISPGEQGRLELLAREPDRRRFLAAASLLRLVGAHHLRTDPSLVVVDRTCPDCERPHGKPSLPGAGIEVSLSHADDLVVLAATRLGEVGVDIEKVGHLPDAEAMADLVVGPDEPVAPGRAEEQLLRYWTRKESLLKATGAGLRVPMRELTVSPADGPARLLSWAGDEAPGTVSMVDLVTRDGYCGALTVLASGPFTVVDHDGDRLTACPAEALA